MPGSQLPITTHDKDSLYLDLATHEDDPLGEIVSGLNESPRRLPSKYFYDDAGSTLFEEITTLDEYYLSRAEHSLLRDNLLEIVSVLPKNLVLVEYGSGSSVKTDILLQGVDSIQAYIPIDISREHLLMAARDLRDKYPDLNVLPVCADYSSEIHLHLDDVESSQIAVFFPGSTIGNFEKNEAVAFLARIRSMTGCGGYLMIGVDLKKEIDILLPAYNDARGITAAFNRNILYHINNRFSADFDPLAFTHRAIYNESLGRIEMYLESNKDQRVSIAGHTFNFSEAEWIGTEYSHKYSIPEFAHLADLAEFDVNRVWTDCDNLFSVQLLVAR